MSIIRVGFDESTNKDLFKNVLRKLFDNTDREAMDEHMLVYKEYASEEEYERDMRIAGLGLGSEVPEGEAIPYSAPYYGSTKDITQAAYGNGFRITHRMNKFNKYNILKKMTKSLKVSQIETRDTVLARVWNDPTAATYTSYVGFDTLALASNSHTILASTTTYDNYGDAGLSHAALVSALNYFDTLIDDGGRAITAKPTRLIYHPQLKDTAHEIWRSDNKSGEMSNTKNVIPDLWDLKLSTYHRYTSASSWAVLAYEDEDYDMKTFIAMEPDLDTHNAYDETRDIVVNSLQYFSFGFGNPQMIYIGDI